MDFRLKYILLVLTLSCSLAVHAETDFEKVIRACTYAVKAFKDGGNRQEMQTAIDLMKGVNYKTLTLDDVSTKDAIKPLDGRLIFDPPHFEKYKTTIRDVAEGYEHENRGTPESTVSIKTIGIKPMGTVIYKFPALGNRLLDICCVAETGRKINLSIKYRPLGSSNEYKLLKAPGKEHSGLPQRKLYGINFNSSAKQEVLIILENRTNKPTSVACITNVRKK